MCRLCEAKYTDVYGLAEHRCPSIIYIEYKCPECFKGKSFINSFVFILRLVNLAEALENDVMPPEVRASNSQNSILLAHVKHSYLLCFQVILANTKIKTM